MEMGPLRGFCKFRGVRTVTSLPDLLTKRGLTDNHPGLLPSMLPPYLLPGQVYLRCGVVA